MKPRVIILDRYDLIELGYLKDLLDLKEKKTFRRSQLITNSYTFTVDNQDDFFTESNPNSPLNGTNWRFSEIKAYNEDGILVWEGVIIDIERDHESKKARLICKNTFFVFRRDLVSYISSTWETGADAFKNICDYVGFTKYNQKAYLDSKAQLEAAGCYLKCRFNIEDGMSFMEAIDKLAEYSNADVYVHNDELYFQHWQPFTGGVSITIEGDKRGEFRRAPKVSRPENNIINDYEIDYDGSLETPATDSNSNNIGNISRSKFRTRLLPGFRTGSGGQIVFKDKVSATYIGESYIKETNRNYETAPEAPLRAEFSIPSDYRKLITLGTFMKINFSEEGWVEKVFETFEFTIDEENDEIEIVAFEV